VAVAQDDLLQVEAQQHRVRVMLVAVHLVLELITMAVAVAGLVGLARLALILLDRVEMEQQ
jgi:hypothetical protein